MIRKGQVDLIKVEKHEVKLQKEEEARQRANEVLQQKALHVYAKRSGYGEDVEEDRQNDYILQYYNTLNAYPNRPLKKVP